MSYVCTHTHTHTRYTHNTHTGHTHNMHTHITHTYTHTHTHNTHTRHTHTQHAHTHNTHTTHTHAHTHTWCSDDNSCSFRKHARDPRHISAAYLAHSTPPVLYKFPYYYKNNISSYTFSCDRGSCYMPLNQTGMLMSNHVAGGKVQYETFQPWRSSSVTQNCFVTDKDPWGQNVSLQFAPCYVTAWYTVFSCMWSSSSNVFSTFSFYWLLHFRLWSQAKASAAITPIIF